jgi:hypothetical protein
MIELIRNCLHGSEIATYIATTANGKKINKVACTISGIDNLKREIEGWNWYQRIRSSTNSGILATIIIEKKNYLKIQIPFINGYKGDVNAGLEANEKLAEKAIRHYCDIWPYIPGKNAALHGDLSIDNIIFNNDEINFLDWEHFSEAGAPWGFDAVYFLFETLWFGMKSRILPNKKESDILQRCLNILVDNGKIAKEIIRNPIQFVKGFIENNRSQWGDQLVFFPNKLPVCLFTRDQICSIEKIIRME